MAGTLARAVQLEPAPSRPVLTGQALPLPSGWQRGGLAFASTGCLGPFVVGACPTVPDVKQPSRPGPVETFVPVSVGAAVECSTLGGPLYPSGDVLDQVADLALYGELLYGQASKRDDPDGVGNPSVVGSVNVNLGEGTSVAQAFGCVEQAASLRTAGRQLWLHTSVAAVTAAADAGIVWRDGQTWRTFYGSVVVASPLLSAGIVDGQLSGITSDPVIATLPVYAGFGARDELMDYDRKVNTATSRSEDLALALFDPCTVVAAGTGVTCPAGTVPPRPYQPPTGCTDVGTWVAQAGTPSGAGELQITPGGVELHTTDNLGSDASAELTGLKSGDVVHVKGQDGHVTVTLSADAATAADVVTLTGTVTETGTAPTASDAVTVCVPAAAQASARLASSDESDPDDPDGGLGCDDRPPGNASRATVRDWLAQAGVVMTDDAYKQRTRDELLELVAKLCDDGVPVDQVQAQVAT